MIARHRLVEPGAIGAWHRGHRSTCRLQQAGDRVDYFNAAGVFQRNVVTPSAVAAGLDYLRPRALRILRQANFGYSIRNEIVWKFDHPFATHNFLAGRSMSRGLSDLYRAQLNPKLASPQTLEPWQLASVFYNNGGGPISRPRNGSVGGGFSRPTLHHRQ